MIVTEKKEVKSTVEHPILLICDVCKKGYPLEGNEKNTFEIQEFHHIRFEGGYGSVFGDCSEVKCDICQHCLEKLVGKYLRIDENGR